MLLRAQRQLVTSNLRYLALMLRPLPMISGPMLLLMTVLDSCTVIVQLLEAQSALLTVYVRPGLTSGQPAGD